MAKTKFHDNLVGRRYYRYDEENKLKTIRIKRVYNPEKISVYDETMGYDHGFIITEKSLKKDYTSLAPDITYSFNIIHSTDKDNSKDILVYGTRYKDIKKDDIMPYIVYRQMMMNPYQTTGTTILGSCMSRDTAFKPEDFTQMFAIHKIDKSVLVHSYLTDTPDDIFKFINQAFLREVNTFLKETHDKLKSKFIGINTNIVQLLADSNFWETVDLGFKILRVPFAVTTNAFTAEQQSYIESNLAYHITNVDIIPYDKDIDLDKIKTEYVIIRDANQHLLLVNYVKSKFNMEAVEAVLRPEEIAQILPSKK